MNLTRIQHHLDGSRVTNPAIRSFVEEWAQFATPESIEITSAEDDAHLIAEALDAEEVFPADPGRYYIRSHPKDTTRSERHVVVATANPTGKGVYNNWRPSKEVLAAQHKRVAGALARRTMYVIPYLMAVPGSPLAPFAAGVQPTDSHVVVMQMIRMTRIGLHLLSDLASPSFSIRSIRVTENLGTLGQGTDEDQRLLATVADKHLIIHYGSSYGGNALLGKITHSLRQSTYDEWRSGKFLTEQFILLGIVDKQMGRTYHIYSGFPSASGKASLAMTLPPDTLDERYHAEFYGNDITWLWVDEGGRPYGMNSGNGVFGVAKDTNKATNPAASSTIQDNSGVLFTSVAYNGQTQEV